MEVRDAECWGPPREGTLLAQSNEHVDDGGRRLLRDAQLVRKPKRDAWSGADHYEGPAVSLPQAVNRP